MRRPVFLLVVLAAIVTSGGLGLGGFVLWRQIQRSQTDSLLIEARAELQAGRRDEAARFFARYLAARRDDDVVRREYADLVLDQIRAGTLSAKGKAAAFEFLEQSVRENPDDHWLRFQLAGFQMRIAEFTSAIDHLSLLRQACPPDGSLEHTGVAGHSGRASIRRQEIDALFGEALVKTGRFQEAVDVLCDTVGFDRAVRRFRPASPQDDQAGRPTPPPPAAFLQLADLLDKELGDEQSAGLVYARNTVVNARDPTAWISLAGWKYFHDQDIPAAVAAVEQATEIAPEDPAVMGANFQIAVYRERYDDAGRIAARGLELHPDQEWPYTASATVALRGREIAGTVDPIVAGLERVGAKPQLIQMLVDLPDEPAWNAALESRYDEIDSLLGREERFRAAISARRLMARGKWLEATRLLEPARPLAAALPALVLAVDLRLAKCHQHLGDFDLALAAAQRAILGHPNSVEARVALAEGLLSSGQPRAALKEFRRVATSLTPERLAERCELWRPLVRLEHTAIDRSWDNRRSREDIEALTASLATGIPAAQRPLLDAESLAGQGRIDDAIRTLAIARDASPDDAMLAAATVALHALSRDAARSDALITGLPDSVRDSDEVAAAAAVSCSLLPGGTAEHVGDFLLAHHPDDLHAAMTAFQTRLRRGRLEPAREAARRIEAIAGPESIHARYAAAAGWALDKRLTADRLPRGDRDEATLIRKQLADLELKRPEWAALQCLIAEIDLLEGKGDAAIARYRRALAASPSDPHVARSLAVRLMRGQRYSEAEQVLAGVDPEILAHLARIAAELRLRAGKPDDAVSLAVHAAESASNDPDELLWFSGLLIDHARPLEAERALERAVAIAPERVDLWLALADGTSAADDAASVGILRRALAAVPETSRGIVQAEIERKTGPIDRAVSSFRTLLEQPNKDLLLRRRAAECFVEAGLPADAEAVLDAMMKIRPRTAVDEEVKRWANRRRAEMLLGRGTFAQAEKGIAMLVENSAGAGACTPEDADLAIKLLARRPEPKAWRLAVEMLESLSKQQPLSIEQRVLVARLLDRLGNWRTARSDLLGLALENDPSSEVLEAFVDLLIDHDDLATAETWLGRLASRAPEAPATLLLEARLARARGDKAAAAEAARSLMPERDVTPDSLSADLATATALERLGFSKAADKLLSQAAQISPAGASARIAFLTRQARTEEAIALLEASRSLLSAPDADLLASELREIQGRADEAESAYRRLLDGTALTADQRATATARLAACLVDRNEPKLAVDLAEAAILEIGPRPDLLDARGLGRLAAGDGAGAMEDFSEAVLSPSPVRLLRAAYGAAAVGDGPAARARMEELGKLAIRPAGLRPADRARLDAVAGRLGLRLR